MAVFFQSSNLNSYFNSGWRCRAILTSAAESAKSMYGKMTYVRDKKNAAAANPTSPACSPRAYVLNLSSYCWTNDNPLKEMYIKPIQNMSPTAPSSQKARM